MEVGARPERTRNMSLMSVTLDVSKLSGWLNADADCRVERRAYEAGSMRAGRWEGVGRRRRKHRAGEDPTVEVAGRARAERTRNMFCMFVTLDVSRLNGWLNAVALCRVEREACEAGRGVGRERAGQWSGGGARCMPGSARLEIGHRAGGRAHPKHGVHGCDVGRVEIERLVERRVLPSRRWGIRSEARCEAERQMGSGAAVAQVACRGGPGGRLGAGQAQSAP